MNKHKDQIIQWLMIVFMIVPVYVLAKIRLHHKNFGLFVVLSILFIMIVWLAYFVYLKKTGYKLESKETDGKKEEN